MRSINNKKPELWEEVVERIRLTIWEWKFYITWNDAQKTFGVSWFNQKYLWTTQIYFKNSFTEIERAKEFINYFLISYKYVKCDEIKEELQSRDEGPF